MITEEVVKAELTEERVNEIHDVACELMSNVDESEWRLKSNEKYRVLITKAVEDYVFENDYSYEEEMELCNQVGI
jgi:hypothetical protein